jgi:hypothetical protein
LIILDGDPFSVYTKVEQTGSRGGRSSTDPNPDDLLYATGGYGAGHDIQPYFCCYDHIINDAPARPPTGGTAPMKLFATLVAAAAFV